MEHLQIAQAAKRASLQLAAQDNPSKKRLLNALSDALLAREAEILAANAQDLAFAREQGLSEALQDRLLLTPERLQGIARDVRHVANLADPVGEVLSGGLLDNGLRISRVRVPLGVVLAIYEARPNVTIDVAALCLKTNNAVILRGGKETRHSNAILVEIIQSVLSAHGIAPEAVQAITNPDRELLKAYLQLDKWIDMVIPRGGAALQQFCQQNARMPVIMGGIGVCHTYVAPSADQARALSVIRNAKTQRPSTCNTLETLLISRAIAAEFAPKLIEALPDVRLYSNDFAPELGFLPLEAEMLTREWGTLDLNVVVVDDLTAALAHIREHGTQHSEAILTADYAEARAFAQQVDAAAVYINASTRFTDGGEFGLGAEVAVSTQKLHARGPMGLDALTTYKWIAEGDYLSRA